MIMVVMMTIIIILIIASLRNDTINLWRQSHWLKCLQGAKVRNWTPIQKIIKPTQ
jgi:hypothetical protein